MLPNGKDLKPLSSSKSDFYPIASPKRDKIAFVSKREGPTSIYVMDTNGGNVKNLSANKVGDGMGIHGWPPFLSWLSDSQIVFASDRRGDSGIFLCNIESGHISLVVKGGDLPVGSPDGKRIAFQNGLPRNPDPWVGMTLAVIGPHGENQVDFAVKRRTSYNRPYWSPNSEEVLYVENDSLGERIIKIQKPDLNSPPEEIYRSYVPWDSSLQMVDVLCLAWSPEGRYITFSSNLLHVRITPRGKSIGRTLSEGVYLFDRVRGETTKLLDKKKVIEISWSPREEQIAVTIERGNKRRIALMNILSGELHYLTPSSLDCWDPQWIVNDE
jgi:Tol biopolymer transport system component